MPAADEYRERLPTPDWLTPALRIVGGFWLGTRAVRTLKRGWGVRAVLSLISTALTTLSVAGAVRWLGTIAVEVDDRYLHVAAGPIERRIPLHDVTSVDVETYNPVRFLGWGYRIDFTGRQAFSQIGVPRGVLVTTNHDGRERRYFVSAKNPTALAETITAARSSSA
jgi:hypothetical protein